MDNLNQLLITGGTAIIIAIVGYIASQVVKALETGEVYLAHWLDSVSNNNGVVLYDTIVEYARLMVHAAEDKAKEEGWNGEEKLQYATDKLYEFIQSTELPFALTREDVENVVRGAYQETLNWISTFEPGVPQLEN